MHKTRCRHRDVITVMGPAQAGQSGVLVKSRAY